MDWNCRLLVERVYLKSHKKSVDKFRVSSIHLLMGKTQKEEKKLLSFYHDLNKEQKKQLVDFAEFLFNKYAPEDRNIEPVDIPRPENEKVVQAIQRLSKSYPMLNKMKLFPKTSELMTANLMEGKETEDAIGELEKIFKEQYDEFLIDLKNRQEDAD